MAYRKKDIMKQSKVAEKIFTDNKELLEGYSIGTLWNTNKKGSYIFQYIHPKFKGTAALKLILKLANKYKRDDLYFVYKDMAVCINPSSHFVQINYFNYTGKNDINTENILWNIMQNMHP